MSVFERAEQRAVEIPAPPRGFIEPMEILHPRLSAIGPSYSNGKKVRVQGPRAQGIFYEKKVQEYLLYLYPKHYLPSPWFSFVDRERVRWCQPDGLLIDPEQGLIVVVEVKRSHIGDAWWKLHKLYVPVVREYFGRDWTLRAVEVVRYCDISIAFPFAKLCEFIHLAPELPKTGVHIWKP